MRKRYSRSFMIVWALAVLTMVWARQADAAQEKKAPESFPENVAKAWQGAGARVGWMWLPGRRINGNDHLFFTTAAVAHSAPTFRFEQWQPGVLPKLPVPAQSFGLDFKGGAMTDDGLKELAGLKNLTMLNLHGTKVTDAGLMELAGLKNLTVLELPVITDETLRKLRTLGLLHTLPGAWRLAPAHTLPVGVSPLRAKSAAEIIWLDLTDPQVTDAGLKELADCKNLALLNLTGTRKITGSGVKELAGLKNLNELLLFSAGGLTDAGLKDLASLKSLTKLNLSYTNITDKGLKELAGMKSLTILEVIGVVSVTNAGVGELRKALPKCDIRQRDPLDFGDF
jgi:internalin A